VSLTDPVADLLTRIRNGQRAGKATITTPASGLRENLLRVLEREGYIRGFERYEVRQGVEELRVDLKYNEGAPVINKIERVSKPGRRVYAKIKDLQKVYNGLGISILSTPRGVMSDQEARQANVGGEVLCQVF
jgi:small subunit ribosomal protein S8